MGDDLGNVVQSRGFQFVEVQMAEPFVIDGELMWSPDSPRKLACIKSKWIYAFQVSSNGQKAILAGEYKADKNGALTFVPGAKRRLVEPAAAPKKGTAIPEVGLPLVFQGDAVRYAFVVARGRLGKAAIWGMENRLSSMFIRRNLADPSVFLTGSDGRLYIPAVDPLTIAENLNEAYKKALNESINYTVVNDNNPHNADVEIRNRKYQLARMIEGSLFSSEKGATDPLGLAGSLAGGGQALRNFIDEYDSTDAKLHGKSRTAARVLIKYVNTMGMVAFEWYLGTPQASSEIGHLWMDAIFRSLDRLNETEEGRDLSKQLVADSENGLLSYLFAPPEDAADEIDEDVQSLRFSIMRKAVTAVAVGLAEMAPALIVYGKQSKAAKLRRIVATLRGFLVSTEVVVVTSPVTGRVTGLIGITRTTARIEIKKEQAHADVQEWISREKGKPHWPEDLRWAKPAEILAKILICVEGVNLYNGLTEFAKKPSFDSGLEATGAIADMLVALEDQITEIGKERQETAAAQRALAAGDSAVAEGSSAAAEAESPGFWGSWKAPVMFKVLGAASAAVDVYINLKKGRKASGRGDTGVAAGHYTIAGGSALIVVASITNGIGYFASSTGAASAAALTAASASLVIVGVVVLVIGFSIVLYFKSSSWQKFAAHSVFGTTPARSGQEVWSGGNFASWTETPKGLDLQIEVLTAMLCSFSFSGAFKISGHGSDAETIALTFGALPPKSALHVEFTIEYEGEIVHRPSYDVNLESLHVTCLGDAKALADLQPYHREGRLSSLLVTADRPASAEGARVRSSECTLKVSYARQSSQAQNQGKPASGTIPVGAKPCEFKIYDGASIKYRRGTSLGDDEED
jgi:hypothetical protein